MNDYSEKRSNLRQEVFIEPATRRLRPRIVDFIKLLTSRAGDLTEGDLLFGEGVDVSSTICGVLAWQGARGVEGDDWLTEQDEPELYELLQITGSLDVDNNQPDKWARLFEIVDRLR